MKFGVDGMRIKELEKIVREKDVIFERKLVVIARV